MTTNGKSTLSRTALRRTFNVKTKCNMGHLVLFFHERSEYERAKDFFENESEFYANEMNDEFKSMTFHEDNDIDSLELAMTDELTTNDFDGFWFGCE